MTAKSILGYGRNRNSVLSDIHHPIIPLFWNTGMVEYMLPCDRTKIENKGISQLRSSVSNDMKKQQLPLPFERVERVEKSTTTLPLAEHAIFLLPCRENHTHNPLLVKRG